MRIPEELAAISREMLYNVQNDVPRHIQECDNRGHLWHTIFKR